jgi:hypothetical protein
MGKRNKKTNPYPPKKINEVISFMNVATEAANAIPV